MLTSYVNVYVGIAARLAPVALVLQGAAGLDADLAALAAQREADHLRGMTMLTARLVQLGCLRDDVTPAEAAAVLTTLATVGSYHHLVLQCGWAVQRFEAWMADTLVATLIAADYQPGGRPLRSTRDRRPARRPHPPRGV